MNNWKTLPTDEILNTTLASLKANSIEGFVVANREEAKQKVLNLLPKGASVMDMTSETLRVTGIADAINTDTYNPVRKQLTALNRETDSLKMQQLGAAPEWTLGSVHAVTQDGMYS